MREEIEGIVVRGDQRGRLLGFPTANVAVGPERELPSDGVYAGTVERADGTVHVAAVSVGRRPQYYDDGERLVEAYLLDFDGDLYGERIVVRLGSLVRLQGSFDTEQELVEQIRRDVAVVRSSGA